MIPTEITAHPKISQLFSKRAAAHPDIKAEIDSIEAKRNADAHRAVYNA